MSFLEVLNVSKQQQGVSAENNISFSLSQYTKLAIAGETGSGKSTLLKMIGGFVQPDSGEILFEDKRVKGPLEKLLPGHPKIAYLSQHFELRNNYRVEEELDYLNQLGTEEANTLYELCEVKHLLKRKTDQVSGGEKQRISLARLLLSSPKLLLLDEPFSNLDIIHKNILKKVIQDISDRLTITCLMISHDPNDLLSWADEIMILKEGSIIQQNDPKTIYSQPVNEYVAALFGSYNVLNSALYNSLLKVSDAKVIQEKIFVRPEDFMIDNNNEKFITGEVKTLRYLGNAYETDIDINDGNKLIVRTDKHDLQQGQIVEVSLK